MLFSDKLRSAGSFLTFSDVINRGFDSRRLKVLSATTSLLISIFYLLVQLMGAGTLLSMLFEVSYTTSLAAVAGLTALLVVLGGMKVTTLVQSIKALFALCLCWGDDVFSAKRF